MELKPNAGSDRAWVWNTLADYADECPKPELLAIRFLNAESKWFHTEFILKCKFKKLILIHTFLSTDAQKFKVKFDECKDEVQKNLEKSGIKLDFLK